MSRLYLRYGVGIALMLVVYFLLTKLLGWHRYPILSAANGLLFGAGILFALKKYKQQAADFDYVKGFMMGLYTGGLATMLFTAFMAIYIFQIDTEFAQAILGSWNLNYNKGGLILILSIGMMGFSTTVVLTLAFMQLLKETWNQN